MVRKPATLSLNVADAKRQFSELLGRVAYGRATVLITRRGRPMARLVPLGDDRAGAGLGEVEGWLDDDDELFANVDAVIARRSRRPRVLAGTGRRRTAG